MVKTLVPLPKLRPSRLTAEDKPMWLFDDCDVPSIKTALPGPKAKAMLERDRKVVSPSYTRGYPLAVARGSGAVIEDVDGNLFLDFTAGIAVTATGHCHPAVVAAIQDQAAKLIHMSGTDFYYEPEIALAERLAALAPGKSPKMVFFANSGTEAIEGALKLARYHTKRSRVIAFYGSFHGRTYGAMSLSASKLVHRRGFSPLVPDIHHAPYPRVAAPCPSPEQCTCIKPLEETVLKRTAPPDEVAAIFFEPVQGEGGYYPAPHCFLKALRMLCDKHGIMLVADEIQSGMCRTGKFFACEHAGIEPDILCTAKGIASGLPLGAIIAKSSVMTWPSGSHASTFGGNPVCCRAALATLDLLEKEYLANAQTIGSQLLMGLKKLQQEHSRIMGDVRGLGLMVAMDIHSSGAAAPALKEKIVDTAYEHGLLILGCGESAIRFCPPLCVNAEQARKGLEILGVVLKKVSGK
jgi:4-aminobutyrate aminotransferase